MPTLFCNARILTMDDARSEFDTLLISDGRIEWVGNADSAPQVGEDTVRIDCGGRTILPGFVEPHMHLSAIAVLRRFENVGPFRFPAVSGALERLREVAAATEPGEWIMGRQFDPSLQEGPGTLTAAMLDAVSTVHPIFVYNASLHFGYCNSLALEIAGITRDTPDPEGSPFGRLADGRPDGVLKGGVSQAMVSRHNPALRQHDLVEGCLDVFRHANSVGFTTICDQGTGAMQGPKELALYEALRQSNRMTARFRYSLFNTLAPDWDASDVSFGTGDSWVRASAWKIVSDGSNQGLSGLQREPFMNADSRGIAYIEPDALNEAVRRRLEQGWPVAVHANGDLAIDRVLDAFEAAREAGLDPARARCRIEHCSILHDEQIDRIADLGLSPSFLIGHVYWWGKAFRDEIFGVEKASLLDRTAACEAKGVRWTLHSDEPVTDMGALRCIENAVTRRLWRTDNEVLAPDECVDVDQALRAMTRDAAWQCHSDHEIGTLEPGKLADLVVLEQDPRSVPPARIGAVRVLETWVGGERVYQA
ncbi:MAG: amidohydrolase family protein [Pseudomonadales bacterium]|nr:amidohydrolase [Pseudomonadales bacterium]NIX09202.1 amidohydrolase family protein [Pseudomonadales bacterium]